jgi:hypothetical protein
MYEEIGICHRCLTGHSRYCALPLRKLVNIAARNRALWLGSDLAHLFMS